MTTDIRNFNGDLEIGEEAERELKRIILAKDPTAIVRKVDHASNGYDLHLTHKVGNEEIVVRIEVKSLAGGYPTGVIEQWANDARTVRPHWMKMGDTDRLYFKNRKENMWYVYDAVEVADWIKSQPESNIRANNNCKDDSGWILKFNWGPTAEAGYNKSYRMPGFIRKFRGESR